MLIFNWPILHHCININTDMKMKHGMLNGDDCTYSLLVVEMIEKPATASAHTNSCIAYYIYLCFTRIL